MALERETTTRCRKGGSKRKTKTRNMGKKIAGREREKRQKEKVDV
jgi:hypothetical protein